MIKKDNYSFIRENSLEDIQNINSSFFQIGADTAYLQWRFEDNPKQDFFYLAIYKNAKRIGFVVYQEKRFTIRLVKILLYDTEVSKDLLTSMANYFFKHFYKIINYEYLDNLLWRKNQYLYTTFLKKPMQVYLTVKSADVTYGDPDNWLLMGGDIQ